MNKHEIDELPPFIGIDIVCKITNYGLKDLKRRQSDGRFPKAMKRKHSNSPYMWRTKDVKEFVYPEDKAQDDERIRLIARQELIALITSGSLQKTP